MIRSLVVTLALILAVTPMTQMHVLSLESMDMTSSNDSEALGWVESLGTSGQDTIHSVVSLANNSNIVAGSFQPPIVIGDDLHENVGFGSNDVDGFLALSNETNEWNWSLALGSIGQDSVNGLALLSDGDLVVAGTYCMDTVGQGCDLPLESLPALEKESNWDEGNLFLARYNFQTGWVWAISIGNQYVTQFVDIHVDDMDKIHLGFIFEGNLEINQSEPISSGAGPSLTMTIFSETGYYLNSFIVSSGGEIIPTGGLCDSSQGETFLAITFIDSVSVPLIGSFTSRGGFDILVVNYNQSGWLWAEHSGGELDDFAHGCVSNTAGGVQVFGSVQGNATFGSLYSESTSGWDAFRANVGSNGGWESLDVEQGVGYEAFHSAYQTASGSIVFAGTMTNQMTLGEFVLADYDEDTSFIGSDVFLAEFDPTESWLWALAAGSEGRDQVNHLAPTSSGASIVVFSFEGPGMFGNHSITEYGGLDGGVWNYETDLDYDGILDGIDNCPRVSNVGQENLDSDIFGDVCDDDDDNDGIADDLDVCPIGVLGWTSTSQTDFDSDGCRDYDEDFDDDDDTVFDHLDLCPKGSLGWISTEETDVEGDGCSDFDTDEDGYVDQQDNCPNIKNAGQEDLDGDLLGDVCDYDEDGDGIANIDDGCPRDLALWFSTEVNDWDRDGCHDDTSDQDDDSDKKIDNIAGEQIDSCPKGYRYWDASNISLDHDQDGCHDEEEDDDDDDDGFGDALDLCPRGLVGPVLPSQDFDADGCVDGEEDVDDDADGVPNEDDVCARTPLDTVLVDGAGCSSQQADTDADGVLNSDDLCPATTIGENVDEDGCVLIENDTKSEGTESSFGINQFLILLALALAGVAAYMTFKPVRAPTTASNEKAVPTLEAQSPAVGSEGSVDSSNADQVVEQANTAESPSQESEAPQA